MSTRRLEFAKQFVLCEGNGTKAAILAGYSESDPSKAARRALLDSRVMAEIKRLSVINVAQWIPFAIRVLIDIASDPEVSADTRRKAAVDLLDRGGMAAPKGGVQVNVGVQVNGNEVQALIGSIWDAKGAKSGDLSGSCAAMPEHTAPPSIEHISEEDGGGVSGFLVPSAASSIPPHGLAGHAVHNISEEVSSEGGGELAAARIWRRSLNAEADDGLFD